MLVITISCPLATPKEVTVTQHLNKNVSRQAKAAEAVACLEVESKEIPSFTGRHLCIPHACVLLKCNLHTTQFTNVVLFRILTDVHSHVTVAATMAIADLFSVPIVLPSLEFHGNEIAHFFH